MAISRHGKRLSAMVHRMEAPAMRVRSRLEKRKAQSAQARRDYGSYDMHTLVGWKRCTSSRIVYGGQHVSRRSGLYSQQPDRRQPRFRSSCHSSGQKLMAAQRKSESGMVSTATCRRRLQKVDAAFQTLAILYHLLARCSTWRALLT